MHGCGSYFRIRGGTWAIPFLVLSIVVLPDLLPAQASSEAVIANRFVNIRTGPGTRYTLIGRANQGERFQVTDMNPEWVEITYRGRSAWVFRKLVSLEQKMPSPLEADIVAREVRQLNQRIDSISVKLEQANRLIASKVAQEEARMAAEKQKKKTVSREEYFGSVTPAWIFVPGGPRIAVGRTYKGLSLAGLTAGFAAAGVYMQGRSRDYHDDYRALDQSAPDEEFQRLYQLSQDRRRLSRTFFFAAAGMFALNAADYFFLLPRTLSGLKVEASRGEAGGQRIHLSLNSKF
ncbi:MAG: SH3 domain-containing protein [Candidatus Glassbacteria bacterium]